MDSTFVSSVIVPALIFIVAALYSSVGHGGASGYLAALSLFAVSPAQMSGTALILNVLVSGIASLAFIRRGHLVPRMVWPFVAVSVPLAFLGGWMQVSGKLYGVLLAIALIIAALRLAMTLENRSDAMRPIRWPIAFPVGGGIGLLSGIVGIGGGVFLSPVLVLSRWATTKQAAAVAALFILCNSLAGLGGRFMRGSLDVIPLLPPLVAAFAGGILGSYLGASRISGSVLRRILAVVLLTAAVKLILTAL